MNTYLWLAATIMLTLSAGASAQDVEKLKAQYLADPKVPEELKVGINTGTVVPGMCPFQAFAAAGLPGPYKVKADKKWGSGVPPPTIVSAQCEHPDDSTIELLFRNTSQFKTDEPVVFRVTFEKGKAVAIVRGGFSDN